MNINANPIKTPSGKFKCRDKSGNWIYFTKRNCKQCGIPFFAPNAARLEQVCCSGKCSQLYDKLHEGKEEEIIIPKVISSDIGMYLTFGKIAFTNTPSPKPISWGHIRELKNPNRTNLQR